MLLEKRKGLVNSNPSNLSMKREQIVLISINEFTYCALQNFRTEIPCEIVSICNLPIQSMSPSLSSVADCSLLSIYMIPASRNLLGK